MQTKPADAERARASGQARRYRAGHTVAGVDHEPQRLHCGRIDIAKQVVHIGGEQLAADEPPPDPDRREGIGLGQLLVDSVAKRDIPVVQACCMLFAGTYIGLNLLADILALLANPRLRRPRNREARA